MQKQADVNMNFESFVELYEKDVKPKLKLNTWLSKEHIIRTKILPYFKNRKLSEITARDVIAWQNEIRSLTKSDGTPYSPDYLKNVHTQLSCLFNHAIRYYGLQGNPAAKAGKMGDEQLERTQDPLRGAWAAPRQSFGLLRGLVAPARWRNGATAVRRCCSGRRRSISSLSTA